MARYDREQVRRAARLRRRRALRMRNRGYTYQQIGDVLEVTRARAQQIVAAAERKAVSGEK